VVLARTCPPRARDLPEIVDIASVAEGAEKINHLAVAVEKGNGVACSSISLARDLPEVVDTEALAERSASQVAQVRYRIQNIGCQMESPSEQKAQESARPQLHLPASSSRSLSPNGYVWIDHDTFLLLRETAVRYSPKT
jgi:hypothetical protein